jgi:murein DD-endopeptidase MepM/ murein hydrolase activator NlpD
MAAGAGQGREANILPPVVGAGGFVYGRRCAGNDFGDMPPNRLIRRLAPLMAVLGLIGAGCGQIGAAHGSHSTLSKPGRLVGVSDPSPSVQLNGENNGPASSVQYVIHKAKKIRIVRRGNNPLLTCPVHGEGFFSRDFGAPRFAGGYHPHAGNDIFAHQGTPIVAPFDGTAVATPNLLGGQAVKVYGRRGYVYNAHLFRYGKLGSVKAGDVIGLVGSTGDALGGPAHDHFELHPNNGPAVDPYPYLLGACAASRR